MDCIICTETIQQCLGGICTQCCQRICNDCFLAYDQKTKCPNCRMLKVVPVGNTVVQMAQKELDKLHATLNVLHGISQKFDDSFKMLRSLRTKIMDLESFVDDNDCFTEITGAAFDQHDVWVAKYIENRPIFQRDFSRLNTLTDVKALKKEFVQIKRAVLGQAKEFNEIESTFKNMIGMLNIWDMPPLIPNLDYEPYKEMVQKQQMLINVTKSIETMCYESYELGIIGDDSKDFAKEYIDQILTMLEIEWIEESTGFDDHRKLINTAIEFLEVIDENWHDY